MTNGPPTATEPAILTPLEIDERSLENIRDQISTVVRWLRSIDEVDTEGVPVYDVLEQRRMSQEASKRLRD